MSRVLACLVVASLLATAALAAEGAASPRNEVRQLVRAYVDAQSKPDATAVLDMVSHKASVTSIEMGRITRGWDTIRMQVDEGIGSPFNAKMTLGVVDVEVLGSAHALAVAPFSATISTPQGEIQVHGALTLVVEKSGGAWKVLHEHSSVQVPKGKPVR